MPGATCPLVGLILAICTIIATNAEAQVSNGPMFGIYRSAIDRALERAYPAQQRPIRGMAATVGYYVGDPCDKDYSFRGEFILRIRHYRYEFHHSRIKGSAAFTLGYIQLPLMNVVRLNRGLRLIAGPSIDVRFIGRSRVDGLRVGHADVALYDTFTEKLKPFGISLSGGVEYRTKGSITLGARMDKSMSRLMKERVDATWILPFDAGFMMALDLLGARREKRNAGAQ